MDTGRADGNHLGNAALPPQPHPLQPGLHLSGVSPELETPNKDSAHFKAGAVASLLEACSLSSSACFPLLISFPVQAASRLMTAI